MNAKILKGITVSFWTTVALLVVTFGMSVATAVQKSHVQQEATGAIPVPAEIQK